VQEQKILRFTTMGYGCRFEWDWLTAESFLAHR
jgi:hypothetical protein